MLGFVFHNTINGMWRFLYRKQYFGFIWFSPCPILWAVLVGGILKVSVTYENKNILNISSLDKELPLKIFGCQLNQGKDQIVDCIAFMVVAPGWYI